MGKAKDSAVAYRATVGMDYATAKGPRRAEIGDVCVDLPAASIPWLLAEGHIVAVIDESVEG